MSVESFASPKNLFIRSGATFAAIALFGCSATPPLQGPSHELEALRGKIVYLGEPETIYASNQGHTRVELPFPVRRVNPIDQIPNSELRISADRGALDIQAKPTLPTEGELISVWSWDGREYQFRVLARPDDRTVVTHRVVGDSASPSVVRASLDLRSLSSQGSELDRAIAELQAGRTPAGYHDVAGAANRIAAANELARSRVVSAYESDAHSAYILEVENLRDLPVRINNRSVGLTGIKRMRSAQSQLAARPAAFQSGEQDESYKALVYVITDKH